MAVFGVDGFAAGEGDALADYVDSLGEEAFEVHLDAAEGRVPAGAVGEGVEVEVGVEVLVETGKDVFVEGGGDTLAVVIGGEHGGDGFVRAGCEVGAEEESVSGGEMRAEAAQDGDGLGVREVADAGADVEGEDAVVVGAVEGVAFGDVVGNLGLDDDAGNVGGEGGGGFVECRRADVDGAVEDLRLEADGGLEKEAGLGGGAGAELGDGYGVLRREGRAGGRAGGGEFEEDVVGMGGEEGALGAGEVVLGEGGDFFEQLGASLVVEEPGREGLLRRGGEAGEGFVENCFVENGGGRDGHWRGLEYGMQISSG